MKRCCQQIGILLYRGGTLAWVRAVGEFGIVMIFAYFPQGIPVKLYTNLQNDGVDAVYTLLWMLLLVTLPLPMVCFEPGKRMPGR